MGVSATIGGAAFTALAAPTTAAQALLSCRVSSATCDTKRVHLVGTTGNLILWGGEAGRKITCKIRYTNTLSNVQAAYATHSAAWENKSVSIVYGGKTYLRCTLEQNGMTVTRDPVATGRGSGFVYMDVDAIFMCDGGVE